MAVSSNLTNYLDNATILVDPFTGGGRSVKGTLNVFREDSAQFHGDCIDI